MNQFNILNNFDTLSFTVCLIVIYLGFSLSLSNSVYITLLGKRSAITAPISTVTSTVIVPISIITSTITLAIITICTIPAIIVPDVGEGMDYLTTSG